MVIFRNKPITSITQAERESLVNGIWDQTQTHWLVAYTTDDGKEGKYPLPMLYRTKAERILSAARAGRTCPSAAEIDRMRCSVIELIGHPIIWRRYRHQCGGKRKYLERFVDVLKRTFDDLVKNPSYEDRAVEVGLNYIDVITSMSEYNKAEAMAIRLSKILGVEHTWETDDFRAEFSESYLTNP